jgi:hypothetical protein
MHGAYLSQSDFPFGRWAPFEGCFLPVLSFCNKSRCFTTNNFVIVLLVPAEGIKLPFGVRVSWLLDNSRFLVNIAGLRFDFMRERS